MPALSHRSRTAAALLVLLAASALFYRLFQSQHFFDMKIYVSAVGWWLDGNDLYAYAQPDQLQGALYYTYPPFAALLMVPLALVPVGVGAAVLTIATVVLVGFTADWLTAPLRARWGWPRWLMLIAAVPLVLLIEPLRQTLSFGQINMVLVALIVADLLVAGPRGSRWHGVGIGLATAVKLVPGIFILYLLVSRQWRAAATAAGTAAGVTLLSAAVAPRASWDFWTSALWDTARVGRLDYTGNQSLQGLLARLVAPGDPSRPLWLVLVLLTLGYGMWRAARAARLGDRLAGLALTGLVAGLISPISWVHHLFWFIPAIIVLVRTGWDEPGRRPLWWGVAAVSYAVCVVGVDTLTNWGTDQLSTRTVGDFLARNAFTLLGVLLVAVLPVRGGSMDYPTSRA